MRKAIPIICLILCLILIGMLGFKAYRYYHEPEYEQVILEPDSLDNLPQVIYNYSSDGDREKEKSPLVIAQENGEAFSPNAYGWIEIPGINIDDPLIYYTDNDRYLHYDAYDTRTVWGAYFLNYQNCPDGTNLDRVSTIFGHSNGATPSPRFGYLKLLRNPENAANYRTIYVWFGDVKTTWRIFAVGDYPVANDYLQISPDDETFMWQMEQMQTASIHEYNVPISEDDKILILSTCTSSTQKETRFIVCAKLVMVE